ncbi:Neural proliferation differentiation and control protein 1, partial [Tupaia chinensis]
LPSTFVPDAAVCPGSLDCALKRRARCPPGAHACGPCLQPFREEQGLCVPRARRPPGEGPPQPSLEEEIDGLAQQLAGKEAGHSRATAQPLSEARLRLLEPAATLGFSERGQGPELGLPSTRGAPAPTPRTSVGSPVSSGPVHMAPLEPRVGRHDGLALVLILAFCVAGVAALAVATLCWCRRKEPPQELDSASSEEENEDGDFTVYECPGLAPTGEMEVRNPLFDHASLSLPQPGTCSPPPPSPQ